MSPRLICICLLSLISCTTTKQQLKAARLVIIYTNAQLTQAHFEDSVRISNLERLVVYLPTSQWIRGINGEMIMNPNLRLDTLDVNAVYVGGRPLVKDSTKFPINIGDTLKPESKRL